MRQLIANFERRSGSALKKINKDMVVNNMMASYANQTYLREL